MRLAHADDQQDTALGVSHRRKLHQYEPRSRLPDFRLRHCRGTAPKTPGAIYTRVFEIVADLGPIGIDAGRDGQPTSTLVRAACWRHPNLSGKRAYRRRALPP